MFHPTFAAADALVFSGSGTPPIDLSECISELVASPVDEKLLQLASTLTHFIPLVASLLSRCVRCSSCSPSD